MERWHSVLTYASYNATECIALLGFAIAFSLKDLSSRNFLFIISCHFLLLDFLHPYIREIDPDKIYRYLIWSLSELLVLTAVCFYALSRKSINYIVCLVFGVLITLSIFALLYRLVDRHVFSLPYAHTIITTIPAYSNYFRVVIGYIGIFIYILHWFKEGVRNVHGSNNNSNSFDDRYFDNNKNVL